MASAPTMTPLSATPVVIGTAGHVDHGKTSLVRELTGIDTDRLPEEKARGISIELGFAWLDLAPPVGRVAFVDVPGHERFVRQMIAGASGIDAVLLVVAADEGVMPQTREHLDICGLLGVSCGAVIVTKADLVDAEWLTLVRDDIARAVAGTFLARAPVIPFALGDPSRRDDVVAVVREVARTVAASRGDGPRDRPFSLPIDRVFSAPGFGTVVTGTTQSGVLAVHDEVAIHPSGARSRVRGLEVHGTSVERVGPGVRVAVNVPELDHAAHARSGLLVHVDGPGPVSMIDATFQPIARLPEPVADGAKGLVHLGTERVEATLAFLDERPLDASGPRPVQLRLAAPVAFLPGCAYVFRGFRVWPGRPDLGLTLGGGRALAPSARRHRQGGEGAATVTALVESPAAALAAWVASHGEAGVPRALARDALPWPRAQLERALRDALSRRTAVATSTTIAMRAATRHLERAVVSALDDIHRERPTSPGLRLDELRTRVRPDAAPDLFARIVDALTVEGAVAASAQADHHLARPGFTPREVADPALRDALVGRLEAAGLQPPRVPELTAIGHELPGAPSPALVAETLAALVTAGRLVRVTPELLFAPPCLHALEARVRAWFTTHERLDAQALKELAGASRKYSIPLGEWLDKAKVTVRMGDERRLRG